MSKHDAGGAAPGNGNGEQAAVFVPEKGGDPGLEFLREIHLSPSEEEEYANLARGWIPALIAFEAGTKEDGWRTVTNLFGVNVCSQPKPAEEKSSLVVCRGRVPMPSEVTIELLQAQFLKVYNNTPVLAQQMRASDPMSRETKILCQVPCPDDEFIRIVWGSFKAAGVAWARDFCFLQHACTTTDPKSGERLFCVVAGSIERPEVPDMEKLCKRIRSTVKTSGFVFRESADKTMSVSYVVNVNPNGWLPVKIVNAVAINQAMNVSRVRNKLTSVTQALKALKIEAPIKPVDIAWRGTHEHPIPRPAAGAAASKVTVKLWATNKIWFRIRGTSGGAASDWKPAEAASKYDAGDWVPHSTPVIVGFTLQPRGASAAAPTAGGDSAGEASTTDVELQDTEACVLEWKAGGWLKGVTVFHVVDIA